MRVDHPIFRAPHAVDLTIEDRPTPNAYFASPELGPTLPMWRVQTEGYLDGSLQLIGLVSDGHGFEDSPDAEVISGGVNSKGASAVAIGRHGNFLQWGFAASPTFMTPEAKLVFVNAIHYVARFDRQAPIVRKARGALPRGALKAILAWIAPSEAPDRYEAVLRLLPEDVRAELGADERAIRAFFTDNWDYLHQDGPFRLAVDADLKRLEIANDDPRLLDHAVAALRKGGAEAAVGRRLLRRYTAESFDTDEEWSAWLAEHRARLFFTEAGGYKWLADRRGAQPADPRERLMPTPADPLDAVLAVEPLGAGRYALTVHVEVLAGWHAYAQAPPGSPYLPITLALDLPDGLERAGSWERPPSRPDPRDPRVRVVEGAFAFRCELRGDARAGRIVCTLGYQACDERMCLPPASEELTVDL